MVRFICVIGLALLIATPASAQSFEHAAAAYERGDFDAAQKIWRLLADKGDAQSQFILGAIYATGKGVPRDFAEAEIWYLKAAKQGLAAAQNNLGFMYDRGLGVEPNDHEAVKWYILAAEQGHAQAQNNLGVMYGTGRGVAKNSTEALKWFQLSADNGNPQARDNLSYLRSSEEPQVAERSEPTGDTARSPTEAATAEDSMSPKDGLTPEAPPQNQVARALAEPAAAPLWDKPEQVKLEAIVSKKVSPELKLVERKPVLEPRPAPAAGDALPDPEVVEKSGVTPANGAVPPGTPVGAAKITLADKTEIPAPVEARPTEKTAAAKQKPAKQEVAKATPAATESAKVPPAPKKMPPAEAGAKKTAVKTAAEGPTYQVQMGSIRVTSDAAAARVARRLEIAHKPVLKGAKVFTMRADLGTQGTFYRLRAGPFPDISAARDVCGKLKARKQPCFALHR